MAGARCTWREAKARDITLAIPQPGECVGADYPPEIDAWWQFDIAELPAGKPCTNDSSAPGRARNP
ncbi:hypothetical protein [Actinoplanes sp. GCM10030250]|uniref:hypothetical protein n=1 Tax=Actinoplanes sp. GCM10030250 TaxID=3273376 RepID=UPI003610EE86